MFSTNDPRPPYNTKVLKERYEREARFFRIHDVFNPSLKATQLAGKFYSKYDKVDLSKADNILLERISMSREGTPHQKYPAPVTQNQDYGWISELFVPLKKDDSRYYAKRVATISKINTRKKNPY